MAKILSVCNTLQPGDYENGSGGNRMVSRLTQFIHAMLQFFLINLITHHLDSIYVFNSAFQAYFYNSNNDDDCLGRY